VDFTDARHERNNLNPVRELQIPLCDRTGGNASCITPQ
jgi:hypothetical protein